jgi:hypothetical protein
VGEKVHKKVYIVSLTIFVCRLPLPGTWYKNELRGRTNGRESARDRGYRTGIFPSVAYDMDKLFTYLSICTIPNGKVACDDVFLTDSSMIMSLVELKVHSLRVLVAYTYDRQETSLVTT